MRRIIFISTLLLFICVSSFGMAFNNHRRGFIIGGLGGVGIDNWSMVDEDGVKIDSGNDIVIHIDLRIGVGFKGDRFILYYWGLGNTFLPDGSSGPTTSAITGVGVSYYFKPIAPSFYVNAGFGAHMFIRRLYGDYWLFGYTEEMYKGLGIMGGIGYEFARHWSVECGVMWGNPSYEEAKINSFAISLSIIGIAY